MYTFLRIFDEKLYILIPFRRKSTHFDAFSEKYTFESLSKKKNKF